jgi:hypothetical protein
LEERRSHILNARRQALCCPLVSYHLNEAVPRPLAWCSGNALKRGLYRKAAIEERRQLWALIRQSQKLLQNIE